MADQNTSQLDDIRNGTVDPAITTEAGLAMAYAGHDWAAQKDEILKKSPEERLAAIEALAHHSLRENPMGKGTPEYDPKDKEHTTTLLDGEINSYIQRSYAKDAAEGKEKGTNLEGYLDAINTANIARGVTDDDFKKLSAIDWDNQSLGDTLFLASKKSTVETLKEDYNKAAANFIDPKIAGKTFEQDLIETVKVDDAKTDDKEKLFAHAKDEEGHKKSPGMMELIMSFIGALLGIDLGGLAGLLSGMGQKFAGSGELTPDQKQMQEDLSHADVKFHQDKDKVTIMETVTRHDKDGKEVKDKDGHPEQQTRIINGTMAGNDLNVTGITIVAHGKAHNLNVPKGAKIKGVAGKDGVTSDSIQTAYALSKDNKPVDDPNIADDVKKATTMIPNAQTPAGKDVVTELKVATAVLGPVGGVVATGMIETGKKLAGPLADFGKSIATTMQENRIEMIGNELRDGTRKAADGTVRALTGEERDKDVQALETFAGSKDHHQLTKEESQNLGSVVSKDMAAVHASAAPQQGNGVPWSEKPMADIMAFVNKMPKQAGNTEVATAGGNGDGGMKSNAPVAVKDMLEGKNGGIA